MKKLMSLFLALVMVFSLAVPALATEPIITGSSNTDDPAKGNVTANFNPEIAITGISFIGDNVTYDADTNTYTALIQVGEAVMPLGEAVNGVYLVLEGTNLKYIPAEDETYQVRYSYVAEGETYSEDWFVGQDIADGYFDAVGETLKQEWPVSGGQIGVTFDFSFSNDGGVSWSDPIHYVVKEDLDFDASITGIRFTGDTVTYDAATNTYTVGVPVDTESVDVVQVFEGTNLEAIPADSYTYLVKFFDPATGNSGFVPFGGLAEEGTYKNGALHIVSTFTSGSIGYTEGYAYSNNGVAGWSDPVYVTFKAAYPINVDTSIENGSVSANTYAVEGETVKLSVQADNTHALESLTVSYVDADGVTRYVEVTEEHTFVMPAAEVTVTATFVESVKTYSVTIPETEGGTVSIVNNNEAYHEGDDVTLNVTPAVGYELDSLTITYVDENGQTQTKTYTEPYTFTMPAADVTVTATFKQIVAQITDVALIVHGVEYKEGTVTLDATSGNPSLKVYGTHLDYRTNDNRVLIGPNGFMMGNGYSWEVSPDGTYATYALSDFAMAMLVSEIWEETTVQYTNNGTDWSDSSVSVLYDHSKDAAITGVSITVDGVEYTSGAVTIYSDSDVTITVEGSNLQNANAFGPVVMFGEQMSETVFTMDTVTDTYASVSITDTTIFDGTENVEIQYCNYGIFAEYDEYRTGTGIYLTYSDDTKPVTYTVNIDLTSNGTVTANRETAAAGETVILTMTPEDGYALFLLIVDGEEVAVDGNTYTFQMPEADVSVTAFFERSGKALEKLYFKNTGNWERIYVYFTTSFGLSLDYGAVDLTLEGGETEIYATTDIPEFAYKAYFILEDGEGPVMETEIMDLPTDGILNQYNPDTYTWTAFSPTVHTTASATIDWGSMAFTYDDTIDEETGTEKGWTNDATDGGTVTVTNTGDTDFTAAVSYTALESYDEITGSFDAETVTLVTEASQTFTLTLEGEPKKAIPAGTKIGVVTVTIK